MTQEQLRIPPEIEKQFHLPAMWDGRKWNVEFAHTLTLLSTYHPTGKSPKYRPVHWHDWMKERTKPWKRPADKNIAWLLSNYKDQFEYEEI